MPQQEPWGGEVHVPAWLRRLLHMHKLPGDTPEAAHEKRKPQEQPSVLENSNRALSGPLVDFYNEGKTRKSASPRRDKR
jgi:hypothetical protein